MIINKIQQLFVISIFVTLGFFMQEVTSSSLLQSVFPEWPFLFSLYFAVSPRYFYGLISAFVVGLMQDVFLGNPLSLSASIYVFGAFVLLSFQSKFIRMPLLLQSLIVAGLVTFNVLAIFIYSSVKYSVPNYYWSFLSIPISLLAWPMIHVLVSFVQSSERD